MNRVAHQSLVQRRIFWWSSPNTLHFEYMRLSGASVLHRKNAADSRMYSGPDGLSEQHWVFSLSDQFEHGVSAKEVLQIAGLTNDYHRAYYSGIIHERQAIAECRRHPDWPSRRQAHMLFQSAMESCRAREIRPPDNEDAALRWNACVRFMEP